MSRRRRAILWCSLAALSAAAGVLAENALRFDRVEATVTRATSPFMVYHGGVPFDFRYTVRPRTYEVEGSYLPLDHPIRLTFLSNTPFEGTTVAIYCNRWSPGSWRWEPPPGWIAQTCNAFYGLPAVFLLLLVHDM